MADGSVDDENMPEAPVPVSDGAPRIRRQSTIGKSDSDYVGTPFFMYCCLQRKMPVREAFIRLASWKWFDRFILFVIMVNCVTMALDSEPMRVSDGKGGMTSMPEILIMEEVYFWVFNVEFIIKVCALGFFVGEKTYLKDPFNILDFVVVVGAVIDKVLTLSGGQLNFNVKPIRALRLLRPLKAVKSIPGMGVVIGAFQRMVPDLTSVFSFLTFVLLLFAILAINMHPCVMRHRCWDFEAQECYGGDCSDTSYMCGNRGIVPGWSQCGPRICGGVELMPWEGLAGANAYQEALKAVNMTEDKYDPTTDKWEGCNVQCSDAVEDNGFALGTKAVGNADIERPPPLLTYGANPNYGITHFDNIFSAFLTIFQCITLEGWTDVMYMMQDSVGGWATFFNVLVIVVGSLVVLSLLLAVIEGSYSEEKDEQDSLEEEELREEKRRNKESRAKLEEEAMARAAVLGSSSPSKVNPESATPVSGDGTEEKNLDSSDDQYHPPYPYLFPPLGKLVDGESPQGGPFANFIMICIVANAFTMCLSVDPRDEEAYYLKDFLFVINLTFNGIFIMEMLLKWAGLGCNNYWSDGMNYFDFIIVVLSIFNMCTDPELFPDTQGNGLPGATALRALRAFRVLKLVRSIESFRSILAVLVNSFQNILNVAVLLMLVMFIFALIGMSFFGGQLNSITGEGLPRSHFDTFGFAFGTIFQILTGENWNEVMYNCMGISVIKAANQQIGDPHNLGAMTAAIYFVLVNFVGNMVMLNLFLAVLLGSFAGADKPGLLAIKLTTTPEEEAELMAAKYGLASWTDVGRTAVKEDFDLDQEQQQALFIYEDGQPKPAKLWMLYGLPSDYKTDQDTGEYDFDGEETRVITHLQLRVVEGDQNEFEQMLEDEEEGFEMVVPNVGRMAPHPDCGKDELDAGKTLCLLAGREENVAPIDALVIALGPNTLAGKPKIDKSANDIELAEYAGLKDEQTAKGKDADEKPFTVVKVDKFSADTEAEIKKFQDDDKRGPKRPKSGSGPGCGATPLMRPDMSKPGDPTATAIDHAYLYSANTAGARKRLEPTISFFNKKPFHSVSDDVREAEELLFKTSDDSSGASGNQVSPDNLKVGDTSGEPVLKPQRLVPRPLTAQQLYEDKGYACCLLGPKNSCRSFAITLKEKPEFDNFILCCIIVGTICLAIDAPIYNEVAQLQSVKTQTLVLSWIDLILTMIFNIEFLTKHIALGVFFGPNAYWQDMWNVLDGVIVIIANLSLQFNPILSSGAGNSSFKSLKALRALRALRPLRTVSRVPSLKVIVKAILGSVPAVSVAFAINLLFMFIFSIMGTQMFAGKMDYCECTFTPVASTHPDYPVSEDSFPCNAWYKRPTVFPYGKHMGYFDSDGPDGKGYVPSAPELQVAPVGMLMISNDGIRFTREHCVGFTPAAHSAAENVAVGPSTFTTIEPPMGADGSLYGGNHTFVTRWVNRETGLGYNCDNVFTCLQCLFEVSTLEGWLDVMYSGMDNNVGPNIQPERNDLSSWTYIVFCFFMFFIITASFLFVNLFVGVIIDSFNDIKSQEDGSIFLTGPQADWLASQDLVANTASPMKAMKSPRAIGGVGKMTSMRQYCYELWWDVERNDTNPGPDNFIMFIIFLNTMTMAMDHCDMAADMKSVIGVLGFIYNIIYTLEMLTKIMAFYFVQYWVMSNWNKFDSTIVIASWLGVAINEANKAAGSSGASVTSLITLLRVARVARVFKVLKSAKTVRAMIGTLIMSVPALINVCMLLILFMFIFAALGMNLFNGVKFGDNLNRYANFNSLGSSFSLMFRFSTGEYWNGVQHDLAITPLHHPDEPCVDRNDPDAVFGNYCGNGTTATIFFTLYTLVLQIILMNLFIAVILEKFSENDPKNLNKLTPDQIEEFANVWVRGDPNGTGIQNAAGLSEIVKKLNHQWYFPLIKKAGIGAQPGTEITYSNTKYGKFDKNIEGMTDVVVTTQFQGGKWIVHWNGKNTPVNMYKPEPPRDGSIIQHTVSDVSPNVVTLMSEDENASPQFFKFENPPLSAPRGGCCGGKTTSVKDEKLITGQKEPTEDANFPSRPLTSNECLQIANLLKVKGDPESTKRQEIQFGAVLIALCECTKGYAIPDYVNDRCAQVQRTALTLDKQFGGGSGIDMGDVGAAVMVQKVFKGRKYRKNCVFKLSVKEAGKQVKIVFAGTDRTGPTSTKKWSSPPDQPRVSFEGQEYPVQWLEALPKNKEEAEGKTLTVRRPGEGGKESDYTDKDGTVHQIGAVEYDGKVFTAFWHGPPSTVYEPQGFTVEIDQEHVRRARAATMAPKGTKNRLIHGRIRRIVTLDCGAKMLMPLNSSSTTGPHNFNDIEMTNKSSPHGEDFAHVNGVVTLADGSMFKNPCKIAVV